ncbi:MAG: EAL domain-containing protein [Novosphingobium sp.]|nr:EAL domain-containing protein [Novosphingobium sp.]
MERRPLIATLRRWWGSRRVRIILTATLIGVIFGVLKVGLPLEDAVANLRTSLRYEVAGDDIVVVKIDDRTLSTLHIQDTPRSLDAVLIEKLASAGAKRIFFDRSYDFLENPADDRKLVEALKAHPGKVYMGAITVDGSYRDANVTFLPAPIFRQHVRLVSLVGYVHPFKLSTSFPFKSETTIGTIPSMSAMLADLKDYPEGIFRPDFAIDVKTIPKVSYIDVINGKVPANALRGRDIVVALTAVTYHDFHPMPSQGYVPGAYFQVVAALTLKKGIPLDFGWLAAFIPVVALIVTGIGRGQPVDRYRIAGIVAIVMFVPFLLEHHNMRIEVVPAAVTAAIAIFRARTLDQVEEAAKINAGSGLPSIQALRGLPDPPRGIVVALKVRNYGAIIASFATPVEAKLANEIVRRIRISDPDTVVHHEGDMFIWVSAHANPLDVIENLEGLHLIMQSGLRLEGREIDLSFNCGVESDVQGAIVNRIAYAKQAAEEAVRQDEIACLHEGSDKEAAWNISLLSTLDRAIDNGDVWVAYQPKLDLRSGMIEGAEALVRWTHPERGSIGPDHFIRLAEDYHRIEKITRFVLNDAVATAAGLMCEGHEFSVSVNISAQLLRNAGLPAMIHAVLDAHGLPPERLILEITETDRLDRSSRTNAMLRQLVDAGLQLSIDDFGTGNATIDYLRYLPASEVKIDMMFIKGMASSREDLLLVQSIIDMAHSLGRRVVAEGVETDEAIAMLKAMNCDLAQGYRVSPPLPIGELLQMLAHFRQKANG